MRKALLVLGLMIGCCGVACSQSASDTDDLRQRFLIARTSYYTPTAAGLTEFSCDIDLDWKAFVSAASGKEVGDDNPFLKYMATVRMSFRLPLHGTPVFYWGTSSVPPEPLEKIIATMRGGMQQMVEGFMEMLKGFLNGEMVASPMDILSLTAAKDGVVHLKEKDDTYDVDEIYSKELVLQSVHVVSKTFDNTLFPTYTDSAEGRLMTSMHGETRQPVTAPVSHFSLAVRYATVAGFSIPSALDVNVQNTPKISMAFSGCTVKTFSAVKAPAKDAVPTEKK